MDELEQYLTTNNWCNYEKFLDMISTKPGFLRFAEVGVWKGIATSYLAKKLLDKSIPFEYYAIDIFDENGKYPSTVTEFEKKNIQVIFNENIKRAGLLDYVTPIKNNSIDAAKNFKKNYFDYILIDANHEEESVIADIKAWWPKLKKNGIFACHDYVAHCGVYPAVNKMLQSRIMVGNEEVMNDMFFIVKAR